MRLSLKWKISIPILIVVIFVFVVLFLIVRGLLIEAKIEDAVRTSRAILLQVEGAREYVAEQHKNQIFRTDLKDLDQILLTVPVFSAMKVGETKAQELGVEFRVPKFQPRNPDNTPDAFEARVLRMLEKGTMPEYWAIDSARNAIRFFRPIKLTEECLACHGDPAKSMEYWGRPDGKDITGTKMEGWKVGEIHGAFEIITPLEPIIAEAHATVQNFFLLFGAGVIILLIVILVISNRISNPLAKLTQIVRRIAQKDYTTQPDKELTDRKDEVGILAQSIGHMTQQLQLAEEETQKLQSLLEQRITQIAKRLEEIAQGNLDFQLQLDNGQASQQSNAQKLLEESFVKMVTELQRILRTVQQSGLQVQQVAEIIAEETKKFEQANREQISELNHVAVSLEEMSTAIDEVARRITQFRSTVQDMTQMVLANQQSSRELIGALKAMAQVIQMMEEVSSALKDKSDEITTVVDVIEEVAEQTNLLALNAAIEAARAGEAGRGFAVVADEVRKLAERTQDSTQQIRQTVASTNEMVDRVLNVVKDGAEKMSNGEQIAAKANEDMEKISAAVQDFDQIAAEVAASAEEQSATVQEITRSFQTVANTIEQNVELLASIVHQTEELSHITDQLAALVQHFRFNVTTQSASTEHRALAEPSS